MRRVLLVSLVLLWGGMRAAEMEWPLLAGGLSGDFRMRSLVTVSEGVAGLSRDFDAFVVRMSPSNSLPL